MKYKEKLHLAAVSIMRSLVVLLVVVASSAEARWIDESGPGNGTDYVKVLFAEAVLNDVRLFQRTPLSALQQKRFSPEVQKWLMDAGRLPGRFEQLQKVLQNIELRFQSDFCTDQTQKPATICAVLDEAKSQQYPVMISIDHNRLTTSSQAMAMLIHEAGHFIGEKDHLFLDQVGLEIVRNLQVHDLILQDAESTEFAVNVFLAQDECARGVSPQVKMLQSQVEKLIANQCQQRGLDSETCQLGKIEWIFQGEPEFKMGEGFTSRVRCQARGVLSW